MAKRTRRQGARGGRGRGQGRGGRGGRIAAPAQEPTAIGLPLDEDELWLMSPPSPDNDDEARMDAMFQEDDDVTDNDDSGGEGMRLFLVFLNICFILMAVSTDTFLSCCCPLEPSGNSSQSAGNGAAAPSVPISDRPGTSSACG